jgi:hypothetical protein
MTQKRYSKECMDTRKELKTASEVLERIEDGCKDGCKHCNPKEQKRFKNECDETIDTFKNNLEIEKNKLNELGCNK